MILKINRDLLVIICGRFGSALIALVSIRLATSLLSQEQYGRLALLVVVQMFCGLFLINPVGMYVNRHTHQWWSEGRILSHLYFLRVYIFVVAIIGALATCLLGMGQNIGLILSSSLAMALMVYFANWNTTLVPMLIMVGQRIPSVKWSLLTAFVGLAFAAFFTYLWPSAIAWFLGLSIGFALGAIGAGYQLNRLLAIRDSMKNASSPNWRQVFHYAAPLAVGTGFMWFLFGGYRLLIEHYWGLIVLSQFAVGFLLANQMWSLVESLAQQYFYPLFYKKISLNGGSAIDGAVSDVINVMLPIYLILAGMSYIASPYLLKLFVSSQYQGATFFLRLGIGVELCRVLANLLSNAGHANQNTRILIWPYAAGALAVLLFMILEHGEGAIELTGYAILMACFLMLFTMWLVITRMTKIQIQLQPVVVSFLIVGCLIAISSQINFDGLLLTALFGTAVIGVFGSLCIFLLLRKNASLTRLLEVELHPHSGISLQPEDRAS